MGGSNSRQCRKQAAHSAVTIAYRTDPATEAQLAKQRTLIDSLNRRLDEAEAEAKKRSDPNYFREQQKIAFQLLLDGLKDMKFVSPLPEKLKQARNVMVIGAVSSGKSSLLNKLYALKLPIGVGHTTTEIANVHNDGDLVAWDAPGCNQDWAFYDPNALNFVAAMSLVVILYRDSLLPLENIVQVVHRIKGSAGMICVRTHCDLFTVAGHTQALTLDQEMKRDKETLASLGITGVRLFKTATTGPNEFECKALKAAMTR